MYNSLFLPRAGILIFLAALNNLHHSCFKVCFSAPDTRKMSLTDFEQAVSSVSLQVIYNASE